MAHFDDKKPIFIQVREMIEDMIVNDEITTHEQVPSTNQIAQFYQINHLTVLKGINQLVDEQILYKKRGIGTFVEEGAKERLLIKRRNAFPDEYVRPLVEEALKLNITLDDLIQMIQKMKRSEQSEL